MIWPGAARSRASDWNVTPSAWFLQLGLSKVSRSVFPSREPPKAKAPPWGSGLLGMGFEASGTSQICPTRRKEVQTKNTGGPGGGDALGPGPPRDFLAHPKIAGQDACDKRRRRERGTRRCSGMQGAPPRSRSWSSSHCCRANEGGPEKLPVDRVEDADQHDRTPSLIRVEHMRLLFPDDFASRGKWFRPARLARTANSPGPAAGT